MKIYNAAFHLRTLLLRALFLRTSLLRTSLLRTSLAGLAACAISFGSFAENPATNQQAKSTANPAHYPQMLRKLGVEGEVLLEFTINEQGTATDIEIIGEVDSRFSVAAINALKNSVFDVHVVDGTPTALTKQKRRYKFELTNLPEERTRERQSANRGILAAM